MIHFQLSADLISNLELKKKAGKRIGFVPTMGALHEGHLSLIREAQLHCDVVVCSIFVNPTQFNQATDLEFYPRPLAEDLKKLTESGCDIVFVPSVEEMYSGNFSKDSTALYGKYIHRLEGAFRPGHFDGVVTVVKKLFLKVNPHEVFFGQKDYQQCLVVKELIQKEFPSIVFHMCPVLRETDGLAMSSRNIRLNEEERKLAPYIYECLSEIANAAPGQRFALLQKARERLAEPPFTLEYLEYCDRETLEVKEDFEGNAVLLVAAVLGKTRLIDNMLIGIN